MPVSNMTITSKSTGSCEIMGPAGTIVQIFMGLFAFLVLTYKRTLENPKREWKVWALDTSKQAISGGLAHILNVISALLMTTLRVEESTADSCAWYLVTMLFDTLIGSMFNIGILMLLQRVFEKHKLEHLKSGNYFTEKNVEQDYFETNRPESHGVHIKHVYVEINYLAWTLQLIIWCLIVSTVKTGLFFIQLQMTGPLGNFGVRVMQIVNLEGLYKLIFVLVLVPTVLNSIQFWITDNFLRKKEFTAEDIGAKSIYFKSATQDKRMSYRKAQTGFVQGTMGQSVVLQISDSPSPRAETQTAHHGKQNLEIIVEKKVPESRRTKSI